MNEIITIVFRMTYDCCGNHWQKRCTCKCEDVCQGCGRDVPPSMIAVNKRFRDTDLEANQ